VNIWCIILDINWKYNRRTITMDEELLISNIAALYTADTYRRGDGVQEHSVIGPGVYFYASSKVAAHTVAAMLNGAYMLGRADNVIINNQPQV
jgi:hypothetical protein